MKLDIEVNERDLEDWKVIIEMKGVIEHQLAKLSDYSKRNLDPQISQLREQMEWLETGWLFCQKERALTKLSEVLNVRRERFTDRRGNEAGT